MRPRGSSALRLAAALALVAWAILPARAASKIWIATPDASWEQLLPYVRANIVPGLQGDEFHVWVCEDATDRTVITPYDDALSDFTKVLTFETLARDRKLYDELEALTDAFRRTVPSMSAEERARYKERFWDSLAASPIVLPTLRNAYAAAASRGAVRCHACEKEPEYAPHARRTTKP